MAVTVEELQILISAEYAEALKGLKQVQAAVKEINKAATAPVRAVNEAVKQAADQAMAPVKRQQEAMQRAADAQKQSAQEINDIVTKAVERQTKAFQEAAEMSAKIAASVPKWEHKPPPASPEKLKEQEEVWRKHWAHQKALDAFRDKPAAQPDPYRLSPDQQQVVPVTSPIKQVVAQMDAYMDRLKQALTEVGNVGKAQAQAISDAMKKVMGPVTDSVKKTSAAFSGMGQSLASVGMIGARQVKAVSAATGQATEQAQKYAKAYSSVGQKAAAVTKEHKKSLGYVAGAIRRTIVMSSLYAVLRGVTSGITEGLKNIAQASTQANATMSALATNALYLKNSIGAALNPVLQALAPAIQFVTDKLAAMFNMIGMLSARIFNNATTFVQAKKAAVDYAQTVKATQNQLAGFDELNILTQQNPGMPNPSEMFEEVAIPQETLSFADKIKRLFSGLLDDSEWAKIKEAAQRIGAGIAETINEFLADTERWSRIGRTISEGINTAFAFVEGFSEQLNWGGIGTVLSTGLNSAFASWDPTQTGAAIYKTLNGVVESIYTFFTKTKWGELGKKIASGLNTAIAGTNFSMIGRTFAAKWNAVFEFFHDAIQEFNWTAAGAGIADAINGWFAEIDWANAGKTISDGALGALSAIGEAVSRVDWKQIGTIIKTFLANIDWVGITEELATVIGNAFGGLTAMIWSLLGDTILDIGDYFAEEIQKAGGNVALGLWNGIMNAAGNVGEWVREHIVDPFIEGFKEAFGIHSPSTVMFEMGVNVMLGLGDGIISRNQNIFDIFGNLVSRINETIDKIVTYIKGDFVNDWVGAWNGVKDKFAEIWGGIKTTASKIIEDIKKIVGGLIKKIQEAISDFLQLDRLRRNDIGKGGYTGDRTHSITAPGFASGAVVAQPTLAWTGEYAGAASNPEIIAPQSIMRETVVEANAPMVAAMYEMATMIIQAIEDNATMIESDADGMYKAWQRKDRDFRKRTGKPGYSY